MSVLNWIFDIYQQSRISNLAEENRQLRAERMSAGPADAERTIGELCLVVKTLKRVMVQKGIVTDAELVNLLAQVDAEDGRRDGRAPGA